LCIAIMQGQFQRSCCPPPAVLGVRGSGGSVGRSRASRLGLSFVSFVAASAEVGPAMNKLKAAALVELGSDPLQGRSGPTKAGDLHKQSEHVKEWRGDA
jgi:hypothetical protein